MDSFTTLPTHAAPRDEDLAEQALPGHGIPSQDPNPAAQTALEPKDAEREARSVMTGGGVVGGAAIGATVGIVVAGPVGVVVGGALGAVAGALGGAAAGSMMSAAQPIGVEAGATVVKNARIAGNVEYREGDGANITIRPGPCQVDETAQDVTLSWVDGDSHGSAAMPLADYRSYVASHAIRIDD